MKDLGPILCPMGPSGKKANVKRRLVIEELEIENDCNSPKGKKFRLTVPDKDLSGSLSIDVEAGSVAQTRLNK